MNTELFIRTLIKNAPEGPIKEWIDKTVNSMPGKKFKIGDKVVREDGQYFKDGSKVKGISLVCDDHYEMVSGEKLKFDEENKCRIWSFSRDAIIGDIIIKDDDILIFAGYGETDAHYFARLKDRELTLDGSVPPGTLSRYKLAGYGDSFKLELALRKKGYRWDESTKHILQYKFKVGDQVRPVNPGNDPNLNWADTVISIDDKGYNLSRGQWAIKDEDKLEPVVIFKKDEEVIWSDEIFRILSVDTEKCTYNVGGYTIPFTRQNELTRLTPELKETRDKVRGILEEIDETDDIGKIDIDSLSSRISLKLLKNGEPGK